MGFLTSLFGGDNNYLTMFIGLAIVLVLIVLAVWLLKLLGQATQSVSRGRNKRLAVIESVVIDQKRQAIIIRRDNIEHLIVTGGPNDLVVESGFEAPPQPVVQRPSRKMFTGGEARTDAETPAANLSRLNGAGPATARSLRHTGLLRANETPEVQLPGGNPDGLGYAPGDSATHDSHSSAEDALETVAETGDRDSAENGKTKRRQ